MAFFQAKMGIAIITQLKKSKYDDRNTGKSKDAGCLHPEYCPGGIVVRFHKMLGPGHQPGRIPGDINPENKGHYKTQKFNHGAFALGILQCYHHQVFALGKIPEDKIGKDEKKQRRKEKP